MRMSSGSNTPKCFARNPRISTPRLQAGARRVSQPSRATGLHAGQASERKCKWQQQEQVHACPRPYKKDRWVIYMPTAQVQGSLTQGATARLGHLALLRSIL